MSLEALRDLRVQAEERNSSEIRLPGSKLKNDGMHVINQTVLAAMNKDVLGLVRDAFYNTGSRLIDLLEDLEKANHSNDIASAAYFSVQTLDENVTSVQRYTVRRFNPQLAEAIDMVRRVTTQEPSNRYRVASVIDDLVDVLFTIVADGSLG